MDRVISQALEEICSQGEAGIELETLFNKIQQTQQQQQQQQQGEEDDECVKQALWSNLLKIPTLQFSNSNSNSSLFSPNDDRIQPLRNALNLNLKVSANRQLCDNFNGLYDEHSISAVQRRVLQRLASARTNGITQNQLSKELGMEGRNFFYVVKHLESRGLIVRHSALMKTRESGAHGEFKACSNVVTNMMYLYRYASHLDPQQRIEILKEQTHPDIIDDDINDNFLNQDHYFKEDISIQDYFPPIKAVCDRLEKADGKVLVVSDIKRDLGYAGAPSGHRAWRTVLGRLKDSQYVEAFDAKVNGKVERCVRLLKPFPSKKLESHTIVSGDKVANNQPEIRFGRHCPITQQLVELPIEHQVYDVVDAEGPEGLTVKEMCGRLGISNKKNYTRFSHMFPRFGMHMQAETDKKAKGYRIWTPGKYNTGRQKTPASAESNNHVEKSCSDVAGNVDVPELSGQRSSNSDLSVLGCQQTSPKNIIFIETDKKLSQKSIMNLNDTENKKELSQESPKNINDKETIAELFQESPKNINDKETIAELSQESPKNINDKEIIIESPMHAYDNEIDKELAQESSDNMSDKETATELSQESPRNAGPNNLIVCVEKPQQHKESDSALGQELDITSMEMGTSIVLEQKTPPSSSKPKRRRSDLRHPCLPTADYTRREQIIVKRIKEEKFILRAELHRLLINLEKDKGTTIDRKSLDRILKDLQEQGHCKYVEIHVPVVTNCGRSRRTHVVMHPDHSVAELAGEIHNRLRLFEIQSRGVAASKCKNSESLPILSGVQRSQECLSSDAAAIKSETMRANGFVLAKMVRTKLLHIFLWEYVNLLHGGDFLSSQKHVNDLKNPHSTCCLFYLDTAIKSIPLELFLQVVGSTQKIDDMVEKCKRGLRISDLPSEEYRCLVDTQATGRLSLLIDILRRLKLIQLVTDGKSEDVDKAPQAIFSHALELKPYIEEPFSLVSTSSNPSSNDLRPRIRHDFSLSNRHAVDEYWKTLEYCYATADPKAALHSFPGSAVNEVFLYRSWASVRVMSADQRAELLKRIMKDDPEKKLSYRECEEIAKDLNLTLEQVLRVYYDKRQRRLNRLSTTKGKKKLSEVQRALASRKRKRTPRKRKTDDGNEQSDDESLDLDTYNQYMEEQSFLSPAAEDHEFNMLEHQEDECLIDGDESRPKEGGDSSHSASRQCVSSKTKPTRQRRFSWTEESDRQLVIQYAKHRAKQGAKFHRVDWSSISGLPAPPSACQKRIASLNRNIKFRKALMRLCNILSERYVNHLKKSEGKNRLPSYDGCRSIKDVQDVLERGISNVTEHTRVTYLEKEQWDDFNDKTINSAFEEVIYCKRVTKLEAPRRITSVSEKWSDRYMSSDKYDHQGSDLTPNATPCENIYEDGEQHTDFARRSRCNQFQRKFIKLLSDNSCVSRQIYESLAVSNAVELFKLVFLSTSTTPEVADLLAETLRRYSEHDLFTAFTYLREKKIMIGGTVGQPYELSQQFLHSISRSPFPANTGKRAAKFSSWLHDREKDLMGGDINLTADLQGGDILHLFALVSSNELSISPCLPDEGVGEADDLRTSKRKSDSKELCEGAKAKKLKTLTESELASRREKGFPGIMVSMSHSAMSTVNIIENFKDEGACSNELGHEVGGYLNQQISCRSSAACMEEILTTDTAIPVRVHSSGTPWKAMSNYAQYLMSTTPNEEQTNFLYPELFRDVSDAILKAGDQGLSLSEISQVMNMPGGSMAEAVIDVLETFGRAFKVNSYDSIQVVAALYRSKYFLTPKALCHQDSEQPSTSNFLDNAGDGHSICHPEIHDSRSDRLQMEMDSRLSDVHRVTILNLPGCEGAGASPHKDNTCNVIQGCSLENDVTTRGQNEADCIPILPWMNGNGTVNRLIYKGLVRRVLGIVMQNPGILEDDIIMRMDVLNPQSCRKLLQLMILGKHLVVRKMHQTTSVEPPSILTSHLGKRLQKPKVAMREHFFANPRSTSIL